MNIRNNVVIWLLVAGLITLIPVAGLAGKGGQDIQALFDGGKALDQLEAVTGFGPRPAGGPAEQEAADYIANEMENLGLEVEIQPFVFNYFEELSAPVFEQVAPNPTTYLPNDPAGFNTMTYSGSGDVTAQVQPVDVTIPSPGGSTSGCETADFAGFIPGRIALIQRGTCFYQVKAANAEAAGAVGVIIFNEGDTTARMDAIQGTLGAPGISIPVVGTSFAIGQELYTLATGGGVTVHLEVDAVSQERASQNIIGTLKGLNPAQGIMYAGAHYDTVSDCPGANDNASGVGALLEAARVLATQGHKTKATMKFIAFGAKEQTLSGSYTYVTNNYTEVSTKGIGMLNLDMIGVGDKLQIGKISSILSSDTLLKYTKKKATAMGLTWEAETLASYDSANFELAGLPVASLRQWPDPYYHSAEDTVDKIQVATLEANGELAAAVIYDWAKNPALAGKKASKPAKALSPLERLEK